MEMTCTVVVIVRRQLSTRVLLCLALTAKHEYNPYTALMWKGELQPKWVLSLIPRWRKSTEGNIPGATVSMEAKGTCMEHDVKGTTPPSMYCSTSTAELTEHALKGTLRDHGSTFHESLCVQNFRRSKCALLHNVHRCKVTSDHCYNSSTLGRVPTPKGAAVEFFYLPQ